MYGSTRSAMPCFAAWLATIFCEYCFTSSSVCGGLFGSRPAFTNAARLYQRIGFERLHGMPYSTSWYEKYALARGSSGAERVVVGVDAGLDRHHALAVDQALHRRVLGLEHVGQVLRRQTGEVLREQVLVVRELRERDVHVVLRLVERVRGRRRASRRWHATSRARTSPRPASVAFANASSPHSDGSTAVRPAARVALRLAARRAAAARCRREHDGGQDAEKTRRHHGPNVHAREANADSSGRTLRRMCDTIVVVGPDRVLFAKNSDRDPNEAQLLDWRQRDRHAPGDRVRCTWIEIEQVSETNAVLLSRPFWMWGAEIGANEHGVVIGNEAVYTDEPYAPSGLTGMDLLRLALERVSTAAEGVEQIVTLLERHGQGGGCGHERRSSTYHNSFIVADAKEAHVVETAGRRWAVEAVTAGARSISNGLTIPGFASHADRLHTHFAQCRRRRAITESGAGNSNGVGGLMAVLRDHGTGGPVPRYSPITGALVGPVRACRRDDRRGADHGLMGRRVASGERVALGHGNRRAVHRHLQTGSGHGAPRPRSCSVGHLRRPLRLVAS